MGRQEENAVGGDVDAELEDISTGIGTVCVSARAQGPDWDVVTECCEEMTAGNDWIEFAVATGSDCEEGAGWLQVVVETHCN